MRIITRFRRWLASWREPGPEWLTPRAAQLLEGALAYQEQRPYIYGVIGRRIDD
jgi:hypothetical protein